MDSPSHGRYAKLRCGGNDAIKYTKPLRGLLKSTVVDELPQVLLWVSRVTIAGPLAFVLNHTRLRVSPSAIALMSQCCNTSYDQASSLYSRDPCPSSHVQRFRVKLYLHGAVFFRSVINACSQPVEINARFNIGLKRHSYRCDQRREMGERYG